MNKKLLAALLIAAAAATCAFGLSACLSGGTTDNGGTTNNEQTNNGDNGQTDNGGTTNEETAHTHAYDQQSTDSKYLCSAATCTAKATYYYSCTCGEKGTKTFESGETLAHSPVTDKAVAATCTTTGLTEGSHCSVCNAVLVAQTTISAHHMYGEKETIAPTKTEKGYDKYVCSLCGDVKQENFVAATGSTGLKYSADSSGTGYTVTGIGTCTDNEIVIPSTYKDLPVTSIGDGAFYWCTSLTSVTIGNSVTSIGDSAFEDCFSLTSVTIGNSVTSIGWGAFGCCNSLTSVTIGSGVTSIGEWAFGCCISLKSITIPDSVTSIGDYAFNDCAALTSVTIGNGVTSIGSYAFEGCYNLIEVYNLSSSLTITKGSTGNGYVGCYAKNVYTSMSGASKLATTEDGYVFYEDGDTVCLVDYTGTATMLTLPDKYNGKTYEVYKYAFYKCTSLTSVTIGNGVTSIGYDAFEGCTSLTSITIPSSVTSIGSWAFYGCTSLTSVTIPDSVTSIGYYAFGYCTSLTNVTFKNTSGWWFASSSSATSGISISSTNLANTSTAAKYLTSTYDNYDWNRATTEE